MILNDEERVLVGNYFCLTNNQLVTMLKSDRETNRLNRYRGGGWTKERVDQIIVKALVMRLLMGEGLPRL